jgi:hypothetical protein
LRRAHSWHVQVVIPNLILSTITHRKNDEGGPLRGHRSPSPATRGMTR